MSNEKTITVGLPRALLYHRYKTLWKSFFDELGIETIVSRTTSRRTVEDGMSHTVDESCLSMKIFMGHVQELVGRCDYILVPRIVNFGRHRDFCVRFSSLYDQVMNCFRESNQKFLSYNVDVFEKHEEKEAFFEMGKELGFDKKQVKEAYLNAKKAEDKRLKDQIRFAEQQYKSEKMKILIAAHSYTIDDAYIGKEVVDFLKGIGVVPIRADYVDRKAALKKSMELSPTCKWEMNREILGSIVMNHNRVDGIVLLSAFPCGPDAMVNELLMRKLKGVPMMNLVLDGQTGTAGIETRLESFVDIISFKKGTL